MILQQAVYGASSGHALLKSSDDALAVEFNNAAWRTDLPATCPAGVTWAPFFRIVRFNSWMLFVHTRPDEGAERGGMVISRAALVPDSMIAALGDLSELATVLQAPWTATDPLPPISVSESVRFGDLSPAVPELTLAIARALVHDISKPVVVIQQQSFDEAIFELWRRAPKEFRTRLTFSLSFGPEDVHELAVVCTPKELASRWDPAQVVDAKAEANIDGHVATFLGLPVNSSVREFARQVDLRLDSPVAISIAMQASELWNCGSTPPAHVQLLRILAERAESGVGSSAAKSVVARRLAADAPNWAVPDVLSMRNLDLSTLGEAGLLAAAITEWTYSRRLSTPDGFLDVLTSWVSEKPKSIWLDAIEVGLRSALAEENAPENLFTLFWRAISEVPSKTERVLSLLDGDLHEMCLTTCVGSGISKDLANQVLPSFLAKGWWGLAGTLLARSRSAQEALTAAISAAHGASAAHRALVAGALSEASPTELTDAAISSHDPVAMQLAAEACVKTPLVLRGFDWKRYEWFGLLKGAFDLSPSVFKDLPDPIGGMGHTVASQMAVEAIWQAVASTPLADLADVPGRERAWDLIPAEYVEHILDVTARSWLKKFERGTRQAAELEHEPRLAAAASAIVKQQGYLVHALRRVPASLPQYLSAFCFDNDREAYQFLDEINRSDIRLTETASKLLGQTLLANKWRDAARDAVHWLNFRQDFHAMYRECYQLLGLVDRMWVTFRLGLPPPLSAHEAWEVFETEAASLYPGGPWHAEVWSRSGGNNEDLMQEGTGREKWHRCVRGLRNGMPPGAEALLREMMSDFSYNDTLRQLARQRFWR